uniref:Uncharacterized protein n=1 Tax=Moniliophthora roreri TaxID=221103 RepID=A0A0W0EVW6_MONRR
MSLTSSLLQALQVEYAVQIAGLTWHTPWGLRLHSHYYLVFMYSAGRSVQIEGTTEMSSRNQPQPQNLKERIAALEQRNNATQPPSSFSTSSASSSGSGFLTPQVTGGTSALKDKIARFEKKGGVPVPRGSFGLGAPPPSENGQPKRRGELVGNRIPSVKTHPTGSLSAQTTGGYGMMGGVSAHTTGVTAHTTGSASVTTHMTGSTMVTTPTSAKVLGLEYNEHDESTGGFAPPDSSLGAPQGLEFSFARDMSSSPPPLPSSARSTSPQPEDTLERAISQSKTRRGQAFAAAMEFAKKAESESNSVYTRGTSPSPSPPPTASRRYSSFGAPVINGDTSKEKDETPVSPGTIPSTLAKEGKTEHEAPASTPELVAPTVEVSAPPSEPTAKEEEMTPPLPVQSPPPAAEKDNAPSPPATAPAQTSPASPPKSPSPKASVASPKSMASTLSEDSDTTVDGKPVLRADIDEDADLFVRPIKRDGHRSPPTPNPTTPNMSAPPTPRDSAVSVPATPNLDVPSARDSILSTERERSLSTATAVASPASETPETPTSSSDQVQDEFGVISQPQARPRINLTVTAEKQTNRASTFSAIVHGKVKESYASHTLPKRAPAQITPVKQMQPEIPNSPGFGDLAMLMAQSALLEQQLTDNGPLEFGIEKRLREEEEQKRLREEEERKAEAEQEREERVKLQRTPSTKSKDSNRSRKLSLKKAFSKSSFGKKEPVPVPVPLEPIPSSPGPEARNQEEQMKTKSKSMEMLSNSPPPRIQQSALEPTTQSLAPPSRTRSTSASTGGSDSDVPPTPPPKSPNHQNKYFASIRRFASSSGASSGAPTHVEKDADLSPGDGSIDSVRGRPPSSQSHHPGAGATNGDGNRNSEYSPDLIGSRTLLETRTRTRSGSRSGSIILVGAGSPTGSVGSSYFASAGSGAVAGSGLVTEAGVKVGVESQGQTGSERNGDNSSKARGDGGSEEVTRGGSLKWPSTTSPKKQSKVGRAASFAEKMWNRARTKSSVSTASVADSDYEPKVSISGSSTYSFVNPPSTSQSLMPPPSPGPSLHDLILSEPLSLSIPEVSEPVSYDQSQNQTPASTSLASSTSTSYSDAPRISWISTSSTGTASPLWDKELFDAFPKVPDTTPTPGHNRDDSRGTVKLG